MKPRLYIETSVISYYTSRPRGIIQKINYRMHVETPVICTPEELIEGRP
jgi:hypothetical protein